VFPPHIIHALCFNGIKTKLLFSLIFPFQTGVLLKLHCANAAFYKIALALIESKNRLAKLSGRCFWCHI
jgi:hypothetical protein